LGSIHNRLPREHVASSTDQGDNSETRVVLSVTDRHRHRHIYIGYLRDSFNIARLIHRHTAEGRLTFDLATRLHRQLARACDSVG